MKTTLIILVSLSVAYVGLRLAGAWRNQRGVDEAMRKLRREAPAHSATVSHAGLEAANVPAIVRAYLKRSLPDGARIPRLASLVQRGGLTIGKSMVVFERPGTLPPCICATSIASTRRAGAALAAVSGSLWG